MHLQRECALSFEIRPSHVNFWTGHLALINRALELEVRVWLDASCGTNRGPPARQIQSRETCRMLGTQPRRTARGRAIHLVLPAVPAPDHPAAGADWPPPTTTDLLAF